MFKEIALAARALLKNPVFAVTVILTISLGIGASTAVFSVVNAVLLQPLPYRNSDRLVLASGEMRKRNVTDFPFSNADFLDLRQGTKTSFEGLAAVQTDQVLLEHRDGSTEQVRYASITPNFFALLGGRMARGRDFVEADGEVPAAANPATSGAQGQQFPSTAAILSYSYWKHHYGGNTAILGQRIENGPKDGPEIVGVLAPGFELFFPPSFNVEHSPDIWVAARLPYDNSERNSVSWQAVGRLRDGVTLQNAQTEVDHVAAELRKNFPIDETSGYHIQLHFMHDYLVAQVKPSILAIMGGALFLLLISCANVANLMLVRMSLKERELAVRSALGATRMDLIRHVLAEAALLSAAGALLGLALAWLGIRILTALAPPSLPLLASVAIKPAVVAFTALLGLTATAIFGIVPAFLASRRNIIGALRTSGRSTALSGGRLLRNSVVVAEIALSFALLIGSGLMLRSFIALKNIDPGFQSHGLLTFQILSPRLPVPEQRRAFMREIQDRLRRITGVEAVTAGSPFPLADQFFPIRWGTGQALSDPSKFQAVDFQLVLPGYFETLHTPLLAGRTFTDADNSPTRNLVVIDEALAKKAFPGESIQFAVGKRILIRIRTPEPEWVEVIGVVAHQRDTSLATAGREQLYSTDGFLGYGNATRWAIRTSGDPAKYETAVRSEVAQLGKQLILTEVQPMDVIVEQVQASTRFAFLLIGLFAFIAAFLAALGIYGVLSTAVRQRTAEVGVRMALGAGRGDIFSLVLKQGLLLGAIGIFVGFAAAFGLTHFMTSMLIGVKITDPATFAAIVAIFLLIAALASWLPARRAADLDPVVALRQE